MILTAHQPVYLPWLGLFHKIALADHFCIFDVAQYQKKDFNNRNKIKTSSGPIWLTVPVESKNHFEKRIDDIKIINNGWNRKHFKSIDLAYKKAPFYKNYIDEIESLLVNAQYETLSELNYAVLLFSLETLKIKVPITRASELSIEGAKSDLVLDMCKKLGAEVYIFGALGKDYADVNSFLDEGVSPWFQDYAHPVYPQQHGKFEPYMSILDLFFNMGPDSLEVLMSGNVASLSDGLL